MTDITNVLNEFAATLRDFGTRLRNLERRPNFDYEILTWPVVWEGTVVNPAIGNGILTGNYVLHKRSGLIAATIHMVCGTTTTYGNGDWTWSLPYQSVYTYFTAAAWIFDSGLCSYIGLSRIATIGGLKLYCYLNATGQLVGDAHPMVWTTGDRFNTTIVYQTP